jgi:hypothetical protein
MFDKLKEVSAGAVADKAGDMIRDFNDAIPTIKALGLSVSDMSFKMGLPPEIGATFTGSVEALDQAKIKELIERHAEKKMITALLETLRTASNLKDQLRELEFRGVKVDVKLGISPTVEVGLLTK